MEELRSQVPKLDGPDYEIFAFKYGEHVNYPSYLFHWLGDPPLALPQTAVPVGYYYWLLKGDGKNILVDVGCTAQTGESHGMAYCEDNVAVLEKMGLTPKDIDAIIITHLDYDHFEGISAFKDSTAPVYLHQAAFNWIVTARKYPAFRALSIPSIEEVNSVNELQDSDKIRMLECGHGQIVEITPGVWTIRADGHFDGLLAVAIKTAKGLVLLTGDACYLYSNLEKKWPIGLIRTTICDALDIFTIADIFAENGATVVPGHDPTIMDKFPTVKPGVAKIA